MYVVVFAKSPSLPVMVMVYIPAGALLIVTFITELVLGGLMVGGSKTAVMLPVEGVGLTLYDRLIGFFSPVMAVLIVTSLYDSTSQAAQLSPGGAVVLSSPQLQ